MYVWSQRGKYGTAKSRLKRVLLPAWPQPTAQGLMSTTKPPSSPEGRLALTELLTPQQEPFTQSVINFSSAACGFRLLKKKKKGWLLNPNSMIYRVFV